MIYAIMEYLKDTLEDALINDVAESDTSRATLVMVGPLQGDPDPDTARIYVTIHENDPNDVIGDGANASTLKAYADEVEEIEIGGAVTWKRNFTIRARCLLVDTQETLDQARQIASKVRRRIERAVITASFSGVTDEYGAYVSRGPISWDIEGETLQAGGPESYDFHITVHFSLLTTEPF